MLRPQISRALLVATIASSLAPLAAGDLEPETTRGLNLFQKVARADLVVDVTIVNGALRFALVDVREILKGQAPGRSLRIAFRDYNYSRHPGVEPIVFPNGQEEILFLVARKEGRHPEKHKDLFDLYLGQEGRITVPPEGSRTLLEALRRLVDLSKKDPSSQIEALAAQLASDNPYLLQAALDEIQRLRVATPSLYGRLIPLLQSPSPVVRSMSLRLLAAIFAGGMSSTGSDGAPDQAESALSAVLERSRNDASEEVRVQAVGALAAWPVRLRVEGDLKAIARQDPAQAVRYEAERALLQSAHR